ncbi:oligosaccharide flippase family protein [Sphingomonas sp. M1-B02]|uniref:oligosaccharide flippase family protein n=1 Tax=Sphingomonas sp. M1-B02 TaxID=3114300 RepID=UPI00223F38CB|nr:oligosaccharide flippase family protein [Sphingomonas sp. S6-11]UZK67739.1 oligosaccharide flippase family protein [Sphingomonas sp. S6-11]
MSMLTALKARLNLNMLGGWHAVALAQAGWVSVSFAGQQILRLFTNIVLARLLDPQLLGMMVVINSLRTGGELLTDVGVGQSIVNNPKGAERPFYSTAWTIQIMRGVLLFAVSLILTLPISNLYENPALIHLLPVAALTFLISGFTSPSQFLLQKHGHIKKFATFELLTSLGSAIIHIALAFYAPSVWALILGLVFSTGFTVVCSFFIYKGVRPDLALERNYAREVFSFGKWVFFATLIYFVSTNFDRLYFAGAIPFALLGLYGIARTFADAASLLMQRVANLVIFPRVASSGRQGHELRQTIAKTRFAAMMLVAVVLAVGLALSEPVIHLLYDERYRVAGLMLPIMILGVWFAILASVTDAILLGIGRPKSIAVGNFAKLVWIVLCLPPMLAHYGIFAALIVLALGDGVRYIALSALQIRAHLSFIRQDLTCTFAFFALAALMRFVVFQLGLVESFPLWPHFR